MAVKMRQYRTGQDFDLVSAFLMRHYQPDNRDGNWIQPMWEYMHSHPAQDEESLDRIGIWEDAGEIVAVANYESRLGEAFFQLHSGYAHLKPEMLDYAEQHLCELNPEGERLLAAYVPDFDARLEALVQAGGYQLDERRSRPMSRYQIRQPYATSGLPPGFRVKSLADENDLEKINRVLWRGFNHPGEPPAEELPGRLKMQSGPNFRKDLTMVVEAPDGQFVSFCGLWYEPFNRIAYVEPMATDPDYRRMGLGRAAMLEGIRRCGELGATVAWVGSDQPFYLSSGFELVYENRCWVRRF